MALPSPSGWEDSLAADRRRPSAHYPNSRGIGGGRQGVGKASVGKDPDRRERQTDDREQRHENRPEARRRFRFAHQLIHTWWAHFEFTRIHIEHNLQPAADRIDAGKVSPRERLVDDHRCGRVVVVAQASRPETAVGGKSMEPEDQLRPRKRKRLRY
jgi:hypothetical protein